jgi:hypothetical protein
MTKDIGYFLKAFDKQFTKFKRIGNSNIPYGSNVMPILKMYKDLTEYSERRNFEAALEDLLTSQDEERRRYAIDICLGFLTFRDAI